MSLNLFGKPLSADKHYFLRIGKPEDKLVLYGIEEHIPRKDAEGNWMSSPETDEDESKQISPNIDLVPTNLKSDDFLKNIEKGLYGLEETAVGEDGYTYSLEDKEYHLSKEEVKQIMAEIRNEK